MPEKRERRTYTDEFKNQIVQLHLNRKQKSELIREYDLTPLALDRWLKQANTSGSFHEKDNRSDEEKDVRTITPYPKRRSRY